jgi:ectoine hydroxylase-related dioxygenase (phytanoyl-CoA dioxygenase family)
MNNSKYFLDENALDVPWVESPFFYSILENKKLSEEQKQQCVDFHERGYLIVDLDIPENEIQQVVSDMYKALEDEKTVFHADHFTYTETKRIFEHWKTSQAIAKLTVNPELLKVLEMLYSREALPFSTINFVRGSNQPIHSDTIHFHTVPSLWMSGVWIALEDVSAENGSLTVVPGSHKWPVYDYYNLNLPHPDLIENGEAVNYRQYEEFIESLIQVNRAERKIVKLKKGQALIWAANMLHGGCNVEGITDLTKTRLTQANHYFYRGCSEYYHPMFSNKLKGEYATKWCNEETNIKTHLIEHGIKF